MITSKEIGKIFIAKREGRGLTADEAAAKTHIHPNVIKDIEGGVFDRLNKVYLKSFLKKYSDFLGADTADIVEKYESISKSITSQKVDLDAIEEKPVEPVIPIEITKEKIQILLVAGAAVLLLILLFVLGSMLRSCASERPDEKVVTTTTKTSKASTMPKTQTKAIAPVKVVKPVKKSIWRRTPVEKIKRSAVALTLKARDEVWVQLSDGGKVVFVGVLDKGDSKTWRTDGTFTVWTGKAEMLEFSVNTYRIGTVAGGVIKNIRVSSKGISIDGVLVVPLD